MLREDHQDFLNNPLETLEPARDIDLGLPIANRVSWFTRLSFDSALPVFFFWPPPDNPFALFSHFKESEISLENISPILEKQKNIRGARARCLPR